MIKFIHKKHMHRGEGENKFVIYYNVSDIFLGTVLLVLVVFFIHDYLSNKITRNKDYKIYNIDKMFRNPAEINKTLIKP